jgi:hypothetical protein
MNDLLEFGEALDERDFGLIISEEGQLKGIWIPEGQDDDPIPEVIVELCKQFFGIDPNNDNQTLH